MKPNKSKLTILQQVCQLIPGHIVQKLANKHKIQTRSFSPWSHLVSMLYAQLAHSISLNDICDCLGNHSGALKEIRDATAPRRNTLSYANKTRNADMAEELFWEVLNGLQEKYPHFGINRKYSAFPQRFKRTIYAVDSTTIKLVANCLDWAKHRRRKAAAKCHMQLNLQSFLPNFALVKPANTHDSTEAKELCANIVSGEIVVFDKAYIDFKHLYHLDSRGVFWVSRSKDNMAYEVTEELNKAKGRIIRDQKIILKNQLKRNDYPEVMRLIEAEVEIEGKVRNLVFITNNFEWAGQSIADIYKSRWGVEVFFKQVKQTLQISDFLGHNENAIRWQVWTALLTYVLLRFLEFQSQWEHSFSRMFTVIRGVMWSYLNLFSVLESCGTANAPPRRISAPPEQLLFNFSP